MGDVTKMDYSRVSKVGCIIKNFKETLQLQSYQRVVKKLIHFANLYAGISGQKCLKGMLHQGLKAKKLNNFSNFKSVVCELRRISL